MQSDNSVPSWGPVFPDLALARCRDTGTLTLTLTTSRVTSDRWPLTSSVGDICPDPCNLSSSARHPLTMSSEVR